MYVRTYGQNFPYCTGLASPPVPSGAAAQKFNKNWGKGTDDHILPLGISFWFFFWGYMEGGVPLQDAIYLPTRACSILLSKRDVIKYLPVISYLSF